MTSDKTALIVGGTGLVGAHCLRLLLQQGTYGRVVALLRRPVAVESPKLVQKIVDFDNLDGAPFTGAADVFCALGTTIRKAGSQAKFREVDFEYPQRLATLMRRQGATHFSLVSALGADRRSPFFYSRVKGELEQAVRAMDWPSLCIVRPSVIAGDRAESRPFERLAEHALRFAPRTWRPVDASAIAATMVNTALRSPPGTTVIESREIR